MESYVDSDDDDYDEDFLENDVDSDDDYDDYSSRISTTTEETSVSRQYARKHRTRRRYKNYRNQNMSRVCSWENTFIFSSRWPFLVDLFRQFLFGVISKCDSS